MRPMTVAAEEGLDAFREVYRAFDDGKVRRMEIHDLMEKITSLQESFSKVRQETKCSLRTLPFIRHH